MTLALNEDPAMLDRLEADLTAKVIAAFAARADINAKVMGVYSIDDMERLVETELSGSIVVGVGFSGAVPATPKTPSQINGDRQSGAKTAEFSYLVIIGVPANDGYASRPDATALLSILRFFIQGTTIENSRTGRPWDWVQERPEVAASTNTMLYYSQLWKTSIPFVARNTL